MPVILKKMQMNVNQSKNVKFTSNSKAAAGSMHIQKNGAGLQSSMVTRISGAKSGCGCGK
jgi:hypothetical protein